MAGAALGDVNYVNASSMNTNLTSAITTAGYKEGDSFTLQFIVQYTNTSGADGNPAGSAILTLDTSYFLYAAGGGTNAKAGLTSSSSGMAGAAYATGVEDNPTTTEDESVSEWGPSTLTASTHSYESANGYYYGWISKKKGDAQTATAGSLSKINDATFTLTYDASTHKAVLTMNRNDEIGDAKVTMNNVTLNANNLEFATITGAVTSFTSQSIPEPATATLSLLALAGLAARRRRK